LATTRADVLVVGAGPAGIAAAIAASLKGFEVVVADPRKPPIDKPCGEGLFREGVFALRALGIHLNPGLAFPLAGFRFADEQFSATAVLTRGTAFGIRRTTLHQVLVDRATEVGVSFLWGERVSGLCKEGAIVSGKNFSAKWIVGADGQSSSVRKWAHLDSKRALRTRFGFRRHFAVEPWTDGVEIHWAERCQMFVTPTSRNEVCVALLSSDSRLRTDSALALFPQVAQKLRGAEPTSAELGSVTALSRARAVHSERVFLAGDASFTVDGIAGQGVGLGFEQALRLAEALERNDPAHYASAHRRITTMPARFTRLLLQMNDRTWLRRKALRLFSAKPGLFARVVSVHMGETSSDELKMREIFGFGWQFLRA
jgi:menaquinone-9 beta-reductase